MEFFTYFILWFSESNRFFVILIDILIKDVFFGVVKVIYKCKEKNEE